jgi:hypothetical protein
VIISGAMLRTDSRAPRLLAACAVAACAVAACAVAPPPPLSVEIPPAPTAASPSTSPTSPTADASAVAPPAAPQEPPSIALPEPAACVLPTARWRGVATLSELRFRADGPVFARVAGVKGSLHFPLGRAADGALLDLIDSGLALRGHLAGADVALHPARGFVMGDAVIPQARATLLWSAATPGALAVTFDPHDGIALVQPPLSATLPCDALSLDVTSVDARAAVPDQKPGKRELLRVGGAVPLSLTPGGATFANLTAKAGADAEVTVMERAGQSARILWSRPDSFIFGWVPAASLQAPTKPTDLFGHGTGSGSGFGRSIHPITRVVCPDDVPVIADAGGERMTVGRILAGTTINVMDRGQEYRAVVVATGGVQVPNDVELRVREDRIKICVPKTP